MRMIVSTLCLATVLAGTSVPQGAGPVRPAKASTRKMVRPKVFELNGKAVDASLSLKDIHGKIHKLEGYRGKVVAIVFWSKTCPWVVRAADRLDALHKDLTSKGAVMLAINANNNEIGGVKPPAVKRGPDGKVVSRPYASLTSFVKEHKIGFPILADHGNKVADMFQAKSTPHCYVLDKKGVIRYAGALDNDMKGTKGKDGTSYVGDAVHALLAGNKVEVDSTRPYG